MREICIVPRPVQATPLERAFELGPSTRILVSESTRVAGEYLHELLQAASGYLLAVSESPEGESAPGTIQLTTADADAPWARKVTN